MNKKEIQRLVDWTKKLLGIEDLNIEIDLQDDPPDYILEEYCESPGVCFTSPALKLCKIWVSPKLCKEQSFSVELVILHEIVEGWFAEAGLKNNNEHKHYIVDRTAIILETLWFLTNGKTKSKDKKK